MIDTLIIVGIAVLVLIILIVSGNRSAKIDNYSEKSEKTFENAHNSMIYHRNYIFLTLLFFLLVLETQNISPYVEKYMKIPNAFGTMIAFGIGSILATSIGAYQARKMAADGKLTFGEIRKILFFVILALSADAIYLVYGYNVHVLYYDIVIHQYRVDFKEIGNPVYGYTREILAEKRRGIQAQISSLTIQQWEGYYRFLTLCLQVGFNVILNYVTTFGYALRIIDEKKKKEEEDDDEKEDDKEKSKGGDDPGFLQPLTEEPDPFRTD